MIQEALLEWFDGHHRVLPWRTDRTPYGTWISEAMLQQTRVVTVLDYYPRFLQAFPDPFALSQANEDTVLKLWEGLGYYSRARNLQRGAHYICEHFDGKLPSDPKLLQTIPGIGPYMAGAIASQAFNIPVPAVDGNCIRIYSRLHALPLVPTERSAYNEVYTRVLQDIPSDNPGDFNEALMDLGATICTPKSPRCEICPLAASCSAMLLGKQTDFPLPKPKKIIPIEEHTILKVFVGNRVLVNKRPNKGLLAGLFEYVDLPGQLSSEEVVSWVREHLPVQCAQDNHYDIRVLGHAHHIFTHLRWNMLGYEIHFSEDCFRDSELDSSLGSLISKEECAQLAFPTALSAYHAISSTTRSPLPKSKNQS